MIKMTSPDQAEQQPMADASVSQQRIPRKARRECTTGVTPAGRSPVRKVKSGDGSGHGAPVKRPNRSPVGRAKSTADGPAAGASPKKPLRAVKSGDGSMSPSGGGGGAGLRRGGTSESIRRTRTDGTERVGRMIDKEDEDEEEEEEEVEESSEQDPSNKSLGMSKSGSGRDMSRMGGSSRKALGRSNTGSGLGRLLPQRTKSGDGNMTIGANRSAPRRQASGLGRVLPRRAKSSDGSTSNVLGGGLRKGRKKEKAGATENSLNIFGSDIVSASAIIEDIQKAADNQCICRLELEDFFMAERENPEEIALALKELLENDNRPWECVQFMDDIMDGAIYNEFADRRKRFLRAMHGVFDARLIPVSYRAKITLSSGSLNMDQMVELLFYLQGDKSVTDLTLKSEQVDESIIRALTKLFTADKRKWHSVTLQLSGTGPGKPGSPEHKNWAKEMQTATQEMQKACSERGIKLG